MNLTIPFLLGALIPVIAQAQSDPGCSRNTLSPAQVISLQTRLFAALGQDDRRTWDLLVAPEFRAFERGKQYSSSDFFGLVADVHKKGIQLVWSVTESHIESDCRLAVMSYVNVGSIAERGDQPKPQRWLETVAFRLDGSTWRAVLMTSMRVDE